MMVTITEFGAGPALDGGVTITTAAPTAPEGFVQPTSAELRKLEALVYRLRPDLDLRADRDFLMLKHTRELSAAFLALSWMGRREKPDHGKSIAWWSEYARELLREGGIEAQIPNHILIAAALAHGDVAHARNALGLMPAYTGTSACGAWKTVLKSGAILPPSPEQSVQQREPPRISICELVLPVGTMPTGTR